MRNLRNVMLMATALTLAGTALAADDDISWAFPRTAPGGPPGAKPTDAPLSVPGSTQHFSTVQLRNRFEVSDWFPASHPAAPAAVLHGHAPAAMACGFCHLPDGEGRPENVPLAGLPAAYIQRQVRDIVSGARLPVDTSWGPTTGMQQVARAATPAEVAQAAAYFSKLKYRSHVRVVEAAQHPAVVPDASIYRLSSGPAQTEPSPRIIEAADDFGRFEQRDASVGYTAYVPVGAIARGKLLATTGGHGTTQRCSTCHGGTLTGGLGPPLAGRSPSYLFRQLYAFRSGARHGSSGAPMKPVVARLATADMVDLAAYVGSLKP
jgi:cytochrome c553